MRRKTQRTHTPGAPVPALLLVFFCVTLLTSLCPQSPAQTAVPAQRQSDAEKTLIGKAQALEARGRPDIAVQVWQQILLSDPNNPMALEGVARDYRLSGNSSASDDALDKLRKINPSDPNIGRIQGLTSNKTRDARLGQAGALSKAGNPEAAMRIYREYYGDHPPDGDIALAYYETLYATPNGKAEAIASMRAGAARNPGDPRFIVTLGRMLTYDSKSRGEGIKILREHQDNYDAQNAYRQALIWDSANPASAAELKEYLKDHPNDTELEGRLKTNEGKLAEMNSGIARTPAEKAAFAALNAHDLPQAEGRFLAMLDKDANDARAAAGMGFLRMQQNNFGAAISYLSQAEQNGFRDRSVVEGLATSRFWYTMGEASTAFDANQLDVALDKYKSALTLRPRSPEALQGLAGVYAKNQQFPAAAQVYQQLLKLRPTSLDAWRGLFFAESQDNQMQLAMATMMRFPAAVKANLNRDPGYLQTLATIYQANGRDADAQRVLAEALALPFPENGATLKAGTRLQYAGILMQAKRYDQAAEQFKQVLNQDTTSLPAWMGLVTADHQLQLDKEAINLVEKMPPDTYEAALADPGFLSMLGSIYAQSNQFEIAQGLLERSANLQTKAGGQPSIGLQTQLASIYLQRNDTAHAYALYRQILDAHPDALDAWRGLIGTLQLTNRNTEALQEIKIIPPTVRKQLESNILFIQTEASLYAASGDTVNALALFNRIQKYYQGQGQPPPADVAIQSAYILYNAKNDRALYPVLMGLGAREDLTNAQRQTIQGLWANWSVRRSGIAFDNGNSARAIDILDAAAQAFPDNLQVRKAVAGGYLRAGRNKEALSIYKQIDYQDATAGDFQGAISAALSANDKGQAEDWLRQALDRFPRDPGILASAARFEQARGDNGRAADYWRASINAMPEVTPSDKLAHELVNPEPGPSNGNRPATPQDLATLLNPDADPSSTRTGRTKLPPLPSYGHDPYDPSAPVVLTPQTRATGRPATAPVYPVPTTTIAQLPSSDVIPYTPQYTVPQDAPQTTPVRRRRRKPATTTTTTTVASNTPPPVIRPRRRRVPAPDSSGQDPYVGTMSLPRSEENVTSTEGGFDPNNYPALQGGTGTGTSTGANQSNGQSTTQTPTSAPKTQPVYPINRPLPDPPPNPNPNPYVDPTESAPQYPASVPSASPTPSNRRYQPNSTYQNTPATPPLQPRQATPQNQTYPMLIPQSTPIQKDKLNQQQNLRSQLAAPSVPPKATNGLHITSQPVDSPPMNPLAARAQSLLADQTDGQLTQGFTIRYLPNATAAGFDSQAPDKAPLNASSGGIPGTARPPDQRSNQASGQTLSQVQYTPSAQDAAAGAYSAQRPINQPPTPPELQPTPPQPQAQSQTQTQSTVPPLTGTTKKRRRKVQQPTGPTVPTLVTAPSQDQLPQQTVTEGEPQQTPQSTTPTGLSDQELQERNLPPLRGPWLRSAHRAPDVLSPRDEAEMQLRQIEGGYSAWLGGTGIIAHRSGAKGYDAMTSLEAAFEASVPLGTKARLTFIAHPAFLDSGQADGNAVVSLTTTTTTGTTTAPEPEPFGTETGNILVTSPPQQQNASGIGGEVQLTFGNFAIAGGYTPYGFLVANWTGRANWRPGKGPFTFSFNRDAVKDTQLSYAGLRDPGSATAFFPGNIWGGVVANAGNVQYARGDLNSGFYAGAGGQYLTGYNVHENKRYDGSMGAYFRVYTAPEYGQLNVGANFFAMHYATNLQGFSYGMGGYFSPQAYFLANVPITWTGHYMTRWHYNILGSFGIQAFSQDQETIFPLSPINSEGTPSLPALTSVGANYDVRGQVAYALSDHWFVGGFAGANNSRNYTNVNAGFSVRYLFRSQPSTVAGPTGLFQTDDQHAIRPLTVP